MSVTISAIGAVTPLGRTWAETMLHYRQGRKRLVRDKTVIGPDGLPTRLAPVYPFHAERNPLRRLAQLAADAVNDLLAQRPDAATATVLLSVPAWVRQGGHDTAIVESLAMKTPFAPDAVRFSYSDESTVLDLFHDADEADRPRIIVAADTFLAAQLLDSLVFSNRLLSRNQPHGLIPGEAAVAFLIGAVGHGPNPGGISAVLRACHSAREVMDVNHPDGILGTPLAEIVGRLLDSDHIPLRLLSDLNGERWRSEEIALLLARHADLLPDDLPNEIETPASQMGYCGGAMAGVLLALGCDAASGPGGADETVVETLLLVSQFGGLRTAASLGSAERTNL